jgi:imidazolonepropionase-like amidohydrolase
MDVSADRTGSPDIGIGAAADMITAISARSVIDGLGGPPLENGTVLVKDSRIVFVGPTVDAVAWLAAQGLPYRPIDTPSGHVLPGLIDSHTHVIFGVPEKAYEEVMADDSDEMMLLRATRNVLVHLRAGVTTMRDNGARNRVTFDLREGVRRGYVLAPRLLLSGRPLTITGGHFYFCGQEADGEDEVRKAVRQLVKEGADHIKIMASGGGTINTDSTRACYTVRELRAIVDEAHLLGRRTTAHCGATQSIANVLDAGVDMIEHAAFIAPDGSLEFDPLLADRMAEQGTIVSPTIGVRYRDLQEVRRLVIEGKMAPTDTRFGLTPDQFERFFDRRIDTVRRLWKDHGVPLVSGTDAVARFGDYCIGLELMVDAGMSTMDVILASTSAAARAMNVDGELGTIEPGKTADLIVVDEDPLVDISALREMRLVMLGGEVVHHAPFAGSARLAAG